MRKLVLPVAVLATVVWTATSRDVSTKTLIAPFFIQWPPWGSDVRFLESSGRPVVVTQTQYNATGGVPSGGYGDVRAGENALGFIYYHRSFSLPYIRNGWVELTYPAGRELHAVVKVVYHGDRNGVGFTETEMIVPTVEPAPAFRLQAIRTKWTETGIAVINPTDEPQDVTVVFYPSQWDGILPQHIWTVGPSLQRTWTVGPRHRLSQFLSEFVDLEEVLPFQDHDWVQGVVRVIGEADIAVGALDFNHGTGRFTGVPVSAEPRAPVQD